MKRHDRIVYPYVFNFIESVRGLSVGAPVDFRGIVVGEVTAINTHFDPVTKQFSVPVEVRLYPERFTSRYRSGDKGGPLAADRHQLDDWMVAHGLRAQLKTGNLLTGQLYISLDFHADAPKATIDWSSNPPALPTIPGGLQSLQDSLTSLLVKLNRIPYEAIGNNTKQTLQDADVLLKRLDAEVIPQAHDTLAAAQTALNTANSALQPDAQLTQGATDAMRELARTAATFRTLADYLERNPQALIRGKPEDKK
jgi:paraquat-inducible protein B